MASPAEEAEAAIARALKDGVRAVAVGYSGGKDSLAITELIVKRFERVALFHMFFVPNLEIVEERMAYAKQRWGLDVLQIPHWVLIKAMNNGAYCDPPHRPFAFTLADCYAMALVETGADVIATGAKKADSLWRRRMMRHHHNDGLLMPIESWTKLDVFAFLKRADIPIPETSKGSATGVDLSAPSLLWMHKNHPRDFARICEVFPYAEAIVWRERWYGDGDVVRAKTFRRRAGE